VEALARAGCQVGALGPLELALPVAEIKELMLKCPYPLLGTNIEFIGEEAGRNIRKAVELKVGDVSVAFVSYVEVPSDAYSIRAKPLNKYIDSIYEVSQTSELVILLLASPLSEDKISEISKRTFNLVVIGTARDKQAPRMVEWLNTTQRDSSSTSPLIAPRNLARGTTWGVAEVGTEFISSPRSQSKCEPIWLHVYQSPASGWIAQDSLTLQAIVKYEEATTIEFGKPVRLNYSEKALREYAEKFKGYVGNKQCFPCHSSEFSSWRNTAHAKSYITLLKSRNVAHRGSVSSLSPDCYACHTLAGKLFIASGIPVPVFSIESSVGCESCHGPGLLHVTKHRNAKIADSFYSAHSINAKLSTDISEATCRECHDQRNSPLFSYEQYAERVRHTNTATNKGGDATP